MTLSASSPDEYIYLAKDLTCDSHMIQHEKFEIAIDSLHDRETVLSRKAERKKAREEAERKKAREAIERKKAREETEKTKLAAKDAQEAVAKESPTNVKMEKSPEDGPQALPNDAQNVDTTIRKPDAPASENQHFALWYSSLCIDIVAGTKLTTFPDLPIDVCTCQEMACNTRKAQPKALYFCEHDIEKLLRASGKYSYAWLYQERDRWLPETFGQRCDPRYRADLMEKASQLFQILYTLTEKERQVGKLGVRVIPGQWP